MDISPRYLIYGLIDPRTRMIRYVGRSSSGLTRPRQHGNPSHKNQRTHVANWIRGLEALELEFEITVLQAVDRQDQLNEAEIWWIAFGRASGWPLTNLTIGGDGLVGLVVTEQHREALSAAATARWQREDRAAHAEQKRQWAADPEVRRKLAQQASDQYSQPGAREAQSVRIRRTWESPALRERQVEARRGKGRVYTEEHRAALRERMLGKNNPAKTASAREKIRLSKLSQHARATYIESKSAT